SDLTDAVGKIDLRSRSMTLTADAKFGGAPIKLEWLQKFYAADGRSSFHISGTVNSATGDIFGVPTREMVRGPVDFDARATGELGALDTLSVDADFRKAALSADLLGWKKPQGEPASGSIDLVFEKGGLNIRSMKLMGETADIEGSAGIDDKGRIQSAAFPRFFLAGGADFSATAARDEAGGLDIGLTGPFLNAGPLVQDFLERDRGASNDTSAGFGRDFAVRARIDAVALREGVLYRGASLDIVRKAARLNSFDLSAVTALGASPLTLDMTKADDGSDVRHVAARTDDIGALFSGIFGVTSVRGGSGELKIDLPPAAAADKSLKGAIDAQNLRIFKAPLLARIFAAGSLTGLSDLLNGEGIELSEAHAKFTLDKDLLALDEARASGPSVGITAKGSIAAGKNGEIKLQGAVAPVYQVNSILGKAPIVGDLFVNHEGEGVVALDYQVTGKSAAPVISVNPLSALTPGVLRRMFEQPAPPPQAPNSENTAPASSERPH
ncbi:MAG TPA: AsmA-like C-terminal domain-containing protein, partial [Parvularculaceae bacterium]|nr:AsmA-like C-terminal domain-containing protein [Parvularculaceae bacterium]